LNEPIMMEDDELGELMEEADLYIDTSSLLFDGAERFWNRVIPLLRLHEKKAAIVPAVINELIRHTRQKEDRELARRADNVLHLLDTLEQEDLASLADEEESHYADDDFVELARQYAREGETLLLLTQDKELGQRVRDAGCSHAHVRRLTGGGLLMEIDGAEDDQGSLLQAAAGFVRAFFHKRKEEKEEEPETIICRLCHKEAPFRGSKEGICSHCLKEGTIHYCKRCGRPMRYANYLRYVEKAKPFDYCEDCYQYRKSIYETRECVSCGKTFPITRGEVEFYHQKGWDLPRRCRDCRYREKNRKT
jgi:rRNA-processing protein FCF1